MKTANAFVLMVLFGAAFFMQAAAAQAALSVSANPVTTNVNEGTDFSVNVDINTDESVFSTSLFIDFDNTVLNVTGVTEGNFLKKDSQSTYPVIVIDNAAGQVRYYCTRLGAVGGVTGTGTIVKLNFETLNNGQSTLDINNVEAYDPNVQGLTVDTVTDGSVDVNGFPVLNAIGDKNVNEGSPLSFFVSATDPDAGDTLTYDAQNLPSGATFVGQTFSWTPGYDQSGSYDVNFTVSDGKAVDYEVITITVNDEDRPPVLDAIGAKSVDENSLLSFTVSGSDPDAGDTLTYDAQNLPSGATFVGQTFSWTPGYDQSGSYDVNFTLSDGSMVDYEVVTITVNNVNRAPQITSYSPTDLTLNMLEGWDSQLFDQSSSDPDTGDTLTYSWKLNTVEQATTQSWTFAATDAYCGSNTVTVDVSDGDLSDSQSWNVDVGLRGDTNDDHSVSILDLATIAYAIGTTPGDTYWDANANVYKDSYRTTPLGFETIDILDLSLAGANYGRSC